MRTLVGPGLADLKYYWWQHVDIGGVPVIVSRTGWSSELGFEIYLADASKGDALFDHIVAAGAAFDLKLRPSFSEASAGADSQERPLN